MESTKQIKIEIRNRWTGSVVFEYTKEGNTIRGWWFTNSNW